MDIVERALTVAHNGVRGGACAGFLAAPVRGSGAGVLVLAGSSGRIEDERCRILAREGLTALSVRWFGGPGQPSGICEVPLETFVSATELLRSRGARRIGVLGASKGAEAALHLSVLDPGTDAVVALSPTSLTWANVGPGRDGRTRPYRSSWTWRGEALPFVPTTTAGRRPGRRGLRSPSSAGTNAVDAPSPTVSAQRRSRWNGQPQTCCSLRAGTMRCGRRCSPPRNWPPGGVRPGGRYG